MRFLRVGFKKTDFGGSVMRFFVMRYFGGSVMRFFLILGVGYEKTDFLVGLSNLPVFSNSLSLSHTKT